MGFRSYIGMGLIKLSQWLRYLVIILLPPEVIMNLNKIYFRRTAHKLRNGSEGLNEFEQEMVSRHFKDRNGRILILGCGGGRESIALAKLGFNVVAVDMVEEVIRVAKENATKEGVTIDFVCDEFSNLSLPNHSFDYAFFSLWIYGQIPTAERRVRILRLLRETVKTEGKVVFHFNLSKMSLVKKRLYPVHKIMAWISFGNRGYQLGDRPAQGICFCHIFTAEEEVHDELAKAGFSSVELKIFDGGWGGYAVATP